MKRLWLLLVSAILGASVAGCMPTMTQQQKDMMEQAGKQEIEMVGMLTKGSPDEGMSMENTGWMFATKGMDGASLSVDVSAVKAAAEANVGKRVVLKVTGLGAGMGTGMVGTMKALRVLSLEPVGATTTP